MRQIIFTLVLIIQISLIKGFAQSVNLRYCPNAFSRNNGNGQEVKVFASNILPSSQYYQLALKSGNQGNLYFSWDNNVIFPPVIQRTWITGTDGVTSLNWTFGQTNSGTPFNPPGVPSGTVVPYTFYNENIPPAQYMTLEFVDPIDGQSVGLCTYDMSNGTSGGLVTSDVSSGSDGGLESKSIGTAIAERVFTREINSQSAVIDYEKMNNTSKMKLAANEISEFIPDKSVLGVGYQTYETSPKDIINFTNAKNVMAVDYVFAGMNKAVVFCTFTEKGAYTHTKQVCDRLKGADLLGVDTTSIKGLKVLKHIYRKNNKFNEYAITFTLGKKSMSNQYFFQSEWLIDKVSPQDSLFNFQIWSSDPSVLNKLFVNVLEKFELKAKVDQVQIPEKPAFYVTKASRDSNNPYLLNLLIRNEGVASEIKIKVNSMANEQSKNRQINEYKFNISPKGETTVKLNLLDTAESEISLSESSSEYYTDFVYSNDGVWNLYMPNGEKPEEYIISNDQVLPSAGEYRLFRNVSIKAKTKDYLTVYRIINGGAEAADLRAYNGLVFTSTGQNKIRIRIIKKGIKNFDAQYQFSLQSREDSRTFIIPFHKFTSTGSTKVLDPSDIENISFTFENEGQMREISARISEVKFVNDISRYSEEQFILANEPIVSEFNIFPNPTSDYIRLNSNIPNSKNVEIVLTTVTGAVIFKKRVEVASGIWQWDYPIQSNIKPGLYLLRIVSSGGIQEKKIVIQ